MDNSLSFLLGVTSGVAIGLLIAGLAKPSTPSIEDPDGKIKQEIFDKLSKLKTDIESTVN